LLPPTQLQLFWLCKLTHSRFRPDSHPFSWHRCP
jgi:hypothetical protein